MTKNTLIKVLGLAATVIGAGMSLVTDWVNEQKMEEKIEELEQKILLNSRDFVKLNELTKEKEATEAALEEKMERWEYLEDLAARIAAGE